ncbi:DNA polymerase I [Stenotrophomonas phage vB_SmaS_DLP_5]|uniref:DNA polymerase I n=1 Tax=Stenotrophomonas phage vB_SmaS_DLP_5 TaxID=2044561 RepID=A0A2D2W298_9CAUD|nr:DNA polymerase [Stenotrophomonas phage vB_SmaS_DLP_5]ATS92272.1 DNA polymerase I [Stenotrophomonas phage vB_SmaS_DLP_5]
MKEQTPRELFHSDSNFPPYEEGQVILVMGDHAKAMLEQNGIIPKKRTTTFLRGNQYTLPDGRPIRFTFSAGIGEFDYKRYVEMLTDAKGAFSHARTGNSEPEMGLYRYVEDFSDLIVKINEQYEITGRPVDTSFDTETTGFDPYAVPNLATGHPGAYLICLQFSCQEGTADCLYLPNRATEVAKLEQLRDQLTWLLTSPKISLKAANGKFDLNWMWVRTQIHCTNFKFDTTAVGSLLDENRSNSLNMHAKIYTSMGGYDDAFNASIDKGKMWLVPPAQMLPYAGGDADATLRVAAAEKAQLLQDPALTKFYINILHPALRAFEAVERGGVCVDLAAYKDLEYELGKEAETLAQRCAKAMGGRICAKYHDSTKPGQIALKAASINDFMFSAMGLGLKPLVTTEKTGAPSTGIDHLLMFREDPRAKEFVEAFEEYSSVTKMLSTYVHGFQKHIRSDGRFHPTYWLFAGDKEDGEGGTNTGRLSCRDPAFQTIPKHNKWAKAIRRCFPAPDGMLVLENDYSQGELKIIACLADETNMIEAYRTGKDLHVVTSGRFAGYDYEQMMLMKKEDEDKFDAIRQLGKAGNFGLIYGMGVEGFMAYAEGNYGVKLTQQEAAAFRNGFFESYPRLLEYHARYKAFAKKHGFVRNPLGRVRHLPLINSSRGDIRSKAERQAINSPVQGCLSDLMIWTFAEAWKKGWYKEAPSFGNVHDAMYTYIPEDNYKMYADRQKELMETLPMHELGWNPQLVFTADGKVGKNMAELKKV